MGSKIYGRRGRFLNVVEWRILYENAKLGMEICALRQLVSRDMRGLVMILVGYRSNGYRLKVWERVE